jgi:Spy/CpxP family protein refolding chaperone
MHRIIMAALVAAAVTLAATGARAQAGSGDVDALRTALHTDKRAYVEKSLALTAPQAKKFWPVYDKYQLALNALARTRASTAETMLGRSGDKPMSNLAAKQFVTQNMQAEEAEMKARHRMFNAVMRVLPAATAARYVQLESKFRAIQAYDIAAAFPLAR